MDQESIIRQVEQLSRNFSACSAVLNALGDETRQHLILEMLKMGKCSGVRVGEITERTHLSRPAVSRHLKILRDAGVVSVRREGTMNFYYFAPDAETMELLQDTLRVVGELLSELPDRSGGDE